MSIATSGLTVNLWRHTMKLPWRGKTIRNVDNIAIIKKTITSLAAVAVLFSTAGTALADSLDDQIKAAQADANAAAGTAANAHAQANGYQDQVNQYKAQIYAVQAQMRVNQAKADKVNAAVEDAKVRMAGQKTILSANIKSMYLTSTVSPLEMLVSSGDISSFFNQQQYQDKVKDKIQSAMSEIVKLKADLEKQQADLAKLLADEEGQRQQLAATKADLDKLVAIASQNAAAADQQVQQKNAQVSSLKTQQAALIAAQSRHIGGGASGGSGCGGYPASWCNAAQDSLIDSWGMYNRECVSYAAWAASSRFGHNVPYWGGRGNAKQWPDNARGAGIPVDGSPKVGDVAIYMGGTYGHAMIVESIKGSSVVVSSFNGDNTGHYSVDEWSISSLQFIHFR